MKHLILALVVLTCVSSSVLAEGMTYGVKAGVTLADLTGDIENNERKAVFGGGLFFNYALTEIFSVQPELLFMMKGTKSSELENTSIKLTYFDVPLLLKVSIPTEMAFVPHVFAGPSFGFLMSAKEEYLLDEEDIKEYFKDIDYGLVFGTGFDYMIDQVRLLLDIRYSFSLTTILDENEEEDDEELKNAGITFMAGIGYSF